MIRKVSLAGEPPTTVCTYAREREVGASWGDDGFIVFATSGAGLRRISAAGGKPEVLTVPDLERGEWSHSFPNVMPGSGAVLFTATDYDLSSTAKLVVVETGEVRALAENAYAPRYLPTGHLAFLRDGSVVVAPFELKRLEITGSQVSVTETGMSHLAFPFLFSVSGDGSVVYVEGNSGVESVFGGKTDSVWVDRAGREEKLNWQGAQFAGGELSPDGTNVLFQGIDPVTTNSDIWLVNLARERATRLTFDVAADWVPIWETDGAHSFSVPPAGDSRESIGSPPTDPVR